MQCSQTFSPLIPLLSKKLSLAPCSETSSAYVPSLMSETKFDLYTKPQPKYVLYFQILRFYTTDEKGRKGYNK
jgi:hypothetical protein